MLVALDDHRRSWASYGPCCLPFISGGAPKDLTESRSWLDGEVACL
jgi:hypothetical protein